MASMMIRVAITPAEWEALRQVAHTSRVPITRLVADAIRESLLKGAKP